LIEYQSIVFVSHIFYHTKKEVHLNIVVCIKQVPDSAAKMVVEGGQISWGDAPLVLNPWDEFAIEAALQLVEANGGELTAVSLGGESAKEALKTALAMGCNQAILVSDPALQGADSQASAHVLAAVIQKIGSLDAAFFGKQAIDGDMGVTAAQTARLLNWPMLGLVASLRAADGKLLVEKSLEEGRQSVECQLPAVVSVSKDIGEPRYPSFMGIRKASRATIPVWDLAEIGISAPASVVHWPEVTNPPLREVKTEIITGSSAQEIAEKLADKILEEKVL
jgi:electron transfer flavoprotein beta subunit